MQAEAKTRLRLAARLLAAATLLLSASPLFAATSAIVFNVNSTVDGIDDDIGDGLCHTAAGTCTLRAAVMQANVVTGVGATINLPAGTYGLTRPATVADGDDNGDLNFTTPVSGSPLITLTGAGASSTIIDANGIDRVLTVEFGRPAALSGLTLRNGYVPDTGGGGIYNQGTLSVSGCRISGNTAKYGGGIENGQAGTLIFTRGTISGNNAQFGGGWGQTKGDGRIVESTISGNTAAVSGGGISATYPLVVINSTISQNSAGRNGGGIYYAAGTANVYNTTIVYNQAAFDDPTGVGGGINNFNANGGVLNIRNTVIAGNYLAGSPDYDDCNGTIGIYGSNFLGTGAGCAPTPGSPGFAGVLGSLNELDILKDNGGPTQTVAIVPPSSLLDVSSACLDDSSQALVTDQRGYPRVAGASCDIGAFEYGADRVFASGFELYY
jgi:hypothetical protein